MASGPDTKVGIKVQAASPPPYDHITALRPHVQQPTVADLLGCKLDARWRHSGGKALDQPTMLLDSDVSSPSTGGSCREKGGSKEYISSA